MIILGIETSCDETAAAVVQKSGNRVTILSNIVSSSANLQAKYGGIIPEQAAREQIKAIVPVIEDALNAARITYHNLDAIAVASGPGLIGSLLVGVETAKTLSLTWNKPLIPVNHLIGHFYANWIGDSAPGFPIIGLLVSGGHTDLVLFHNHGKYQYLGGTRDDSAGECFDKCARLLGLPYPGGPQIAKLAQQGNPKAFNLPRPMIGSKDFDFSFSGFKTAVARLVHSKKFAVKNKKEVADLAASIQQAIVDVLVAKTVAATRKHNVDQIMIAGGVAANQSLTQNFKAEIKNSKLKIKLMVPPPYLCTDNAAMIAIAAIYNYRPVNSLNLQADPNLSLTAV